MMTSEPEHSFVDFDAISFPAAGDDLLGTDSDWQLVAILDLPIDAWLSYIQGYRLAANLIKEQVAGTGYDQDFLIWPFVMSWRHHVELQLKNLFMLLEQLNGADPDVPITHKLDLLWDRFEAALKASEMHIDDDSARDNSRRIVLQLNSIDPLSQTARYPVDRHGVTTDTSNSPRIHMGQFNEVMEKVASYLDALDTGNEARDCGALLRRLGQTI